MRMDGLGLTYSVWDGPHPRFPNPIMGSSWAPDGLSRLQVHREGGWYLFPEKLIFFARF